MIAVCDTQDGLRDERALPRPVPALLLSLLFRNRVPGARRETVARQVSTGGAGISQFLGRHFVSGHGSAAVAVQRTAAIPVQRIQGTVPVIGAGDVERRTRRAGRYRCHYRG